jgi:hypothetical protein
MAPDLDDIEEGLFPFECLSDEAKTFVKAYSLLRKMEFFLAGVGFSAAAYLYPDLVPMILVVFALFPIGMTLEVGKRALKVAIDSEAERREEMDHYRKLSQTLCLRERRKIKETSTNE